MASFHGEQVSWAHKVILDELERRGVLSRIQDGQRSLAKQTALFFQNMHFIGGRWQPKPGRPLTAFPRPGAPHIKKGHVNHALDVLPPFTNVENGYEALGVKGAIFNVSSERWHLDFLDEGSLIRVAGSLKRRGGLLVTLKPGMSHQDVRILRYWLMDTGHYPVKKWQRFRRKTKYGLDLQEAVKKFQRGHALVADGIVGPRTWARIERAAKRD